MEVPQFLIEALERETMQKEGLSLQNVGARLDLMRVALGYAFKKDFADTLGITPQTLNHYLHGNADMPYSMREKLWKMGADPNWLYHGERHSLTSVFKEQLRAAELIMGLRANRKRRGAP